MPLPACQLPFRFGCKTGAWPGSRRGRSAGEFLLRSLALRPRAWVVIWGRKQELDPFCTADAEASARRGVEMG